MFKRKQDDKDNDGAKPKRLKVDTDHKIEIIDLSNSQSQEDVLPTERQEYFDSQYYKEIEDDHKKRLRMFPGPAGVHKHKSTSKPYGKATRNSDKSHQNLFKDLTFICPPSDNTTWRAMKDCFDLHYSDKENLINKINIKKIQDKLRRSNPLNGRTPVPFLTAVITDDGGIGTVPNLPKINTCFSIQLEDLTGSITALLDKDVVSSLGHLLRFGSSIILQKPEFHKVLGKPQLSIKKEMVSCVAVNTKYIDLKIWRDTPHGFWTRTLKNDIVLFEQRKIHKNLILEEILEFNNKVKLDCRLSSTKTIGQATPIGGKKRIKISSPILDKTIDFVKTSGQKKINVETQHVEFNDMSTIEEDPSKPTTTTRAPIATENKSTDKKSLVGQATSSFVLGEFDESSDDDEINASMIAFADEFEARQHQSTNFDAVKGTAVNESIEKNKLQTQAPLVQTYGEFEDDSDDDMLNSSMIQFADKYEVKTSLPVTNITARNQNNNPQDKSKSFLICGEFDENDDENDISLAQSLDELENQSVLGQRKGHQQNLHGEQNNDLENKDDQKVFGEFDDDDDDDELDSLLINVMNNNSF